MTSYGEELYKDLIAHIAELEKLLADCDPQWQHAVSENMRLQAENESLRIQVANPYVWEDFVEMRTNDERYRWCVKQSPVEMAGIAWGVSDKAQEYEMPDDAIDAARECEK